MIARSFEYLLKDLQGVYREDPLDLLRDDRIRGPYQDGISALIHKYLRWEIERLNFRIPLLRQRLKLT